jgi:Cu-processing system permease protein
MIQFLPPVVAIAQLTFREVFAKAITWILAFVSVSLLFISYSFNFFAMGDEMAFLREVGLASVRLCGLALVIFLCCGSIADEVARHHLMAIMSKPILRTHYILGKYFGLLSAITLLSLGLGAILMVLIAFDQRAWEWTTLIGIVGEIFHGAILLAAAMIVAPHVKFVVSSAFITILFVVGHLSDWIQTSLADQGGALSIVSFFVGLLPKLQNFAKPAILASQDQLAASGEMLFLTSVYGLGYVLFLLTLASYVYNFREIG